VPSLKGSRARWEVRGGGGELRRRSGRLGGRWSEGTGSWSGSGRGPVQTGIGEQATLMSFEELTLATCAWLSVRVAVTNGLLPNRVRPMYTSPRALQMAPSGVHGDKDLQAANGAPASPH